MAVFLDIWQLTVVGLFKTYFQIPTKHIGLITTFHSRDDGIDLIIAYSPCEKNYIVVRSFLPTGVSREEVDAAFGQMSMEFGRTLEMVADSRGV